tara:strand:- start:897 stop:1205 length:309 start_codon:yes stop_codon:yes gene_type:complete
MIEKDTIVSVVTLSGEYLGKYWGEDNGSVTLKDPRMLISTPDGKVGFARGICMTGEENTKLGTFNSGGVVLVTKTNKDFSDAYIQATTGLDLSATSPSKLII